jgi:hypothetical protein
MIDLATERVVTLRRAARLLPRRRCGRRAHASTLYRWSSRGVRADDGMRADDGTVVVLETIRVGRTLCTSVEALQRFCDRLTLARPAAAAARSGAERERADARAAAACERLGL